MGTVFRAVGVFRGSVAVQRGNKPDPIRVRTNMRLALTSRVALLAIAFVCPTAYFPGLPDRASASVLHLAPRQDIEDVRVPLGKPVVRSSRFVVSPNGESRT